FVTCSQEECDMKKILVLVLASVCCLSVIAQRRVPPAKILSPEEKLNEEYCTGLFKTYEGKIFDMENETSARTYLNILNWLQGRVAGLQINHKRDGTPFPVIRNTRASVYVDELLVDPGFLNSISSSDIAMIKIIKGPFAGGFGNGAGGVVAIYTFKGD